MPLLFNLLNESMWEWLLALKLEEFNPFEARKNAALFQPFSWTKCLLGTTAQNFRDDRYVILWVCFKIYKSHFYHCLPSPFINNKKLKLYAGCNILLGAKSPIDPEMLKLLASDTKGRYDCFATVLSSCIQQNVLWHASFTYCLNQYLIYQEDA